MRKSLSLLMLLSVFLTSILGVGGVSAASIPENNLLINPTFVGAEDSIPPPGWTVYRNLNSLDEHRRISVVDADNPERRALLIEDMVSASGSAGDVGLQQAVDAGPGQYQAEIKVLGVAGASGRAYFQIRFLPSGELKSIPIQSDRLPLDTFETFLVEAVAPPGTTQVRVYVFTHQLEMPSIAIQSISLVRVDTEKTVPVLVPNADTGGNVLLNPSFVGAEDSIPPIGWTVYRNLNSLDEQRRISVVDSDNPEQRALLIEDMASASGSAGDIGLQQTVDAGPGHYKAEMKVRAADAAPFGTVYLQLRFLPSEERNSIAVKTQFLPQRSPGSFETVVVEGVAPKGTTQVRVYVYTNQLETPSIAVRSIGLYKVYPEKSVLIAGQRIDAHESVFTNPTFIGAEDCMPPPGWALYRELDDLRGISVINAENPDQRALLIEDKTAIPGSAGDIGLYQTIDAGPGRYQAEMKARAVAGAVAGTVFFQLEFLPSGEHQRFDLQTQLLSPDSFQSFVLEGVAPVGTTQARVYIYTSQMGMSSIVIQSISINELNR